MKILVGLILASCFVQASQPDTATKETESVSGKVVAENGEPIADATVALIDGREFGVPFDQQKSFEPRLTQSKADGSFSFNDWPTDNKEWYVFAYKDGFALQGACVRSSIYKLDDSRQQSRTATLTLDKPIQMRIGVRSPEGSSIDKAEISLSNVRIGPHTRDGATASEKLLDALQLKPKFEKGILSIDFLPESGECSVIVSTDEYGRQNAYFDFQSGRDEFKLREAGTLKCKVVDQSGTGIAGIKATIASYPERDTSGSALRIVGIAEGETDSNGEFVVEKITTGNAQTNLQLDLDQPMRVAGSIMQPITANETVNKIITIKKGIEVIGKVLDENGNAIPNVRMSINQHFVVSNAEGEFRTYSLPGYLRISFSNLQEKWIAPQEVYATIPAEHAEGSPFEIPPVVINKSQSITGRVLNEDGQPVASADVVAGWFARIGSASTQAGTTTQTDREGNFILGQVPGDTKIQLSAQTTERANLVNATIEAGDPRKVDLAISTKGKVKFTGAIVDEAGIPIAEAKISMWQQWLTHGRSYSSSPVSFPSGKYFETDNSGQFETPIALDRKSPVNFTIARPGYVSKTTNFKHYSSENENIDIGTIVLEKATTASGTVVDSGGNPVPGAAVWSYSTEGQGKQLARSDSAGRFEVGPIRNDSWFVFVDKPGMRITGAELGEQWSGLRITLYSQDEPDPTPPLNFSQTSNMSSQVIFADFLKQRAETELEAARFGTAKIAMCKLAPIAPDLVRKHLAKLENPEHRAEVLFALGELDEAYQVARSIKGDRKIFAFANGFDYAANAEQRMQLLAEYSGVLDSIERPAYRLSSASWLIERLHDMGEDDAAKQVVDQFLETAKKFSTEQLDGYAKGAFADAIGPYHPEEAIEMIRSLGRDQLVRHGLNLTQEMALDHPDKALECYEMVIANVSGGDGAIVPIVAGLAAKHPDRAIAFVDASDKSNSFKNSIALAYGTIAFQIRESDPERAKKLLRLAFEKIDQERTYNKPETGFSLLRYAIEIDPQSSNEYFWRTLSQHPGPGFRYHDARQMEIGIQANSCQVAIVLATFDRLPETQKRIVEPVFESWTGINGTSQTGVDRHPEIPVALRLFDFQRACDWAIDHDQRLPKSERRGRREPWIILAELASRDERDSAKWISENVFNLWVFGKED